MQRKRATVLAVTLGDPGGIGAEIALKAACTRTWPASLRLVLVGGRELLHDRARLLGLSLPAEADLQITASSLPAVSFLDPGPSGRRRTDWKPGVTNKACGLAAATWIRAAVNGCLTGRFDGVVTGPICKKSMQKAGIAFPGHTEYLAHLTGTRQFAMMLMGGPLRVILVTRHIPLALVPSSVTGEGIIEAVELARKAVAWLGLKTRKIGVCALNPHGGEGGTLGLEDLDTIAPAVQRLRERGIDVEGPVPADVIFHHAKRNRYGVVAAMYHDQGLAPLKMIAFERGINITLGLPIIRTSPDHGTAFDLAGKGTANPGSMIEAIRLAARLAHRSNPWSRAPVGDKRSEQVSQ